MSEEQEKKINVLALDLEGTLISNIVSQLPRPHLAEFLEFCLSSDFGVVLYTACSSHSARDALLRLSRHGYIPESMGMMPIVEWEKFTGDSRNPKNLQHAQKMFPDAKLHRCFLVDDISAFVALGQADQWIPIYPYGTPYSPDDTELLRIKKILIDILAGETEVTRRGYTLDIPIIGS